MLIFNCCNGLCTGEEIMIGGNTFAGSDVQTVESKQGHMKDDFQEVVSLF